MSWFGWLTKGRYEVSMLDRLTGFVEFVALLFIGFIIYYFLFEKRGK